MKKIFVTILSIIVAIIAAYGIKYAMTPVNSQKIEYISHEDAINTHGYIIHDEWIATANRDATVCFSADDGERVAKDSIVGELFFGNVPEERIKELNAVDNKIKTAKSQNEDSTMTNFDDATVENGIYRRENAIITAAANNDISAIVRSKKDINSLRESKTLSYESELKSLESQRASIIGGMGLMKQDIGAQISGIFTTYIDGYENSLRLSDINNYNMDYFNALSNAPTTMKVAGVVDAGGVVCKIVNNHIFYVLMSVPTDKITGHEEGENVTIRLDNMSSATASGKIYHIGEDEGGKTLVTVSCQEYIENAFSYRSADIALIFERYEGYKIPVHALRTEGGSKYKVIGIHDGKKYDCYVNVLYTDSDGGYAIAQSTDDSENKLSLMSRIEVGER